MNYLNFISLLKQEKVNIFKNILLENINISDIKDYSKLDITQDDVDKFKQELKLNLKDKFKELNTKYEKIFNLLYNENICDNENFNNLSNDINNLIDYLEKEGNNFKDQKLKLISYYVSQSLMDVLRNPLSIILNNCLKIKSINDEIYQKFKKIDELNLLIYNKSTKELRKNRNEIEELELNIDEIDIKKLSELYDIKYVEKNKDNLDELLKIHDFYINEFLPIKNSKIEVKRLSDILNTYLNDKFKEDNDENKTFLNGSASFTNNTINKNYDSLNLLFENYFNFYKLAHFLIV